MEVLKKAGKFISKKAFIAFLKKEVKRNAKYKCETTNCPLSKATGFAVDGFGYTLYPQLLDCELRHSDAHSIVGVTPNWARNFIDRFDSTERPKNAKTALMILEEKEEFAPDYEHVVNGVYV